MKSDSVVEHLYAKGEDAESIRVYYDISTSSGLFRLSPTRIRIRKGTVLEISIEEGAHVTINGRRWEE